MVIFNSYVKLPEGNWLFYKMLAWFFHCEGATIRQLAGSEWHQSQLASCFKGSDEVERTIAHVRSQDSRNFQEASIWISGVVWPNHSSKGVCPKTVTAFHWVIMFLMNNWYETGGMAASPFTQKNVSDQDMQLEIHRKTHFFQISACSSTPGPGVMLSLNFIARHNA